MSSETRLREAIQDSLKEFRDQHAAALDAVVGNVIEAAVAGCASEREADLAGIARLLEGIRALDEAQSITEVLDALADHASREAERVAILIVRGDRIRGWRLTGFGPETPDARSLDLGLDGVGVIVEAVRMKMPKTSGPELSGFGFAPVPTGRAGLAVPIEVGGQVVAAVYADDAVAQPRAVPSAWPEVVEILARHAGRCLEALTALRATAVAQPAVAAGSSSEDAAVERLS